MTNFYRDQQRALTALSTTLEAAHKNKTNISISKVIYEFSIKYPVSQKALKRHLELFAESRSLKITDGEVVMSNVP